MNSNFSPLDYKLNCQYRNQKEQQAQALRDAKVARKMENSTSIMQTIANLFTSKKEEKQNAQSQTFQRLLSAESKA